MGSSSLEDKMRGGGGGGDHELGFRGVMEEEEDVVSASASASERTTRRRRWGAEADDGYSASSTGGSGSFCCDSVGASVLSSVATAFLGFSVDFVSIGQHLGISQYCERRAAGGVLARPWRHARRSS